MEEMKIVYLHMINDRMFTHAIFRQIGAMVEDLTHELEATRKYYERTIVGSYLQEWIPRKAFTGKGKEVILEA